MEVGFFKCTNSMLERHLLPAKLKACLEPLLEAELCGLHLFSDFVFLTQSGRSHSLSSRAKFLPSATERMAKRASFTQAGLLISVSI